MPRGQHLKNALKAGGVGTLNAGFDFYTCRGPNGICVASLDIRGIGDLPLSIMEATCEEDYLAAVRRAGTKTPPSVFPCEWTCAFDGHHQRPYFSYRNRHWFTMSEHGEIWKHPEYLQQVPRALIPGKSVRAFVIPSCSPVRLSGQPVAGGGEGRVVVYNSSGLVR